MLTKLGVVHNIHKKIKKTREEKEKEMHSKTI
jgi:hypothetical protein